AVTLHSVPERPVEQIPDDRVAIEPGDPILLIVEDDPHYARVMVDLARDKGFKVLVAMRGNDALDLARQYQPSAVSLDVFLPDMLGHDDIEIATAATGAEALPALKGQPSDCVVLDLRLPDMSGFEVLEQIRKDAELSDVPVVVFTGRELSAEEDARLHTMARSIVVKGVESPERLLDETALFLHRVVTDLPAEKQRMLQRLNSSDEDLVGRTVLLVDD